MKQGVFITFEGIEGSGKSTQARSLVAFLRRRGWPVLHVREPGGTPAGEGIRRLVLSTKYRGLTAMAETLLYEAARAELVEKKILPALRRGFLVVCDRFQDATAAYQGYGAGVPHGLIETLGRAAARGLKPDLTLFLDLGLRKGLARSGRKDRIEQKPLAYHRRVQGGYRAIWRREPRRVRRIQVGDLARDQARIRDIVLNALQKYHRPAGR